MNVICLLEKRIEKIEKHIGISNNKTDLRCNICGWRGDKADLIDSSNYPGEFVFCPVCESLNITRPGDKFGT